MNLYRMLLSNANISGNKEYHVLAKDVLDAVLLVNKHFKIPENSKLKPTISSVSLVAYDVISNLDFI